MRLLSKEVVTPPMANEVPLYPRLPKLGPRGGGQAFTND